MIEKQALEAIRPFILNTADVKSCHRNPDGTVDAFMRITQQQNIAWRGASGNIRNTDKHRVNDWLKNVLEPGLWNPESGFFSFDCDGKKIAGNHRITAGAMYPGDFDYTCRFFCKNPNTADDTNRGKPGRSCDTFPIRVKDKSFIGHIVTALFSLESGDRCKYEPPRGTAWAVFERNRLDIEAVLSVLKQKRNGVGTANVVAALVYVRPVATALVDKFVTTLERGVVARDDDPVLPLLQALLNRRANKTREPHLASRSLVLNALASAHKELTIKGHKPSKELKTIADTNKKYWDKKRAAANLPVPPPDRVDASVGRTKKVKQDRVTELQLVANKVA